MPSAAGPKGTPPRWVSHRGPTTPTAWCSWYHYFAYVTEDDILENLAAMGKLGLDFDVVRSMTAIRRRSVTGCPIRTASAPSRLQWQQSATAVGVPAYGLPRSCSARGQAPITSIPNGCSARPPRDGTGRQNKPALGHGFLIKRPRRGSRARISARHGADRRRAAVFGQRREQFRRGAGRRADARAARCRGSLQTGLFPRL